MPYNKYHLWEKNLIPACKILKIIFSIKKMSGKEKGRDNSPPPFLESRLLVAKLKYKDGKFKIKIVFHSLT